MSELTVEPAPVEVVIAPEPVEILIEPPPAVEIELTPETTEIVIEPTVVEVEILAGGPPGPRGPAGLPELYEQEAAFTDGDAGSLPALAIRRNPVTGRIYLVRNV